VKWPCLILVSLALGCAASLGAAAKQVRSDIIALPALQIRQCLGVPDEFDVVDDAELWIMARPLARKTSSSDPSLRPEDSRGLPRKRNPAELLARFLENPGLEEIPPGYCRLYFEVANKRISAFEAEGRDRDGLNANARCVILARRCLH